MKSAGPTANHSRSQGGVSRPGEDAGDGDDGDQEDEGDEGNVEEVTDPTKVRQPILHLVNPALAAAWSINRNHEMCFILDVASPARRFKRGLAFNEEADFPQDTCDWEITETDGPGPGWMPVSPRLVRYVWELFTTTDNLIQDEMQD